MMNYHMLPVSYNDMTSPGMKHKDLKSKASSLLKEIETLTDKDEKS